MHDAFVAQLGLIHLLRLAFGYMQLAASGGLVIRKYDCPGNDLFSVSWSDPATCIDTCLESPQCMMVNFCFFGFCQFECWFKIFSTKSTTSQAEYYMFDLMGEFGYRW